MVEYKDDCDCCRVVTVLDDSCYSNSGDLLLSISHTETRDGVDYAIGEWRPCRQHD